MIAGLRPEDFEDAKLVQDRSRGTTFTARIDVLESMGSEFYAYFTVQSDKVDSAELDEIARDAGTTALPTEGGTQVVSRLDAASGVRQREDLELWFNSEHLHLFDAETGQSLLGEHAS